MMYKCLDDLIYVLAITRWYTIKVQMLHSCSVGSLADTQCFSKAKAI